MIRTQKVFHGGAITCGGAQAILQAWRMLRPGLTVLVVDDEASIRFLLSEVFRVEGARVIAAATAAELERALHGGTPDVALIDFHIEPDEDGLSLKRAHELAPAMPVIAMSGTPLPALEERVREYGARSFLAKPFDIKQVLEQVKAMTDPSR